MDFITYSFWLSTITAHIRIFAKAVNSNALAERRQIFFTLNFVFSNGLELGRTWKYKTREDARECRSVVFIECDK